MKLKTFEISKSVTAAVNTLNGQRKSELLSEIPEYLFTSFQFGTLTREDLRPVTYGNLEGRYFIGVEFAGLRVEIFEPLSGCREFVRCQSYTFRVSEVSEDGYLKPMFAKNDTIFDFYYRLVPPFSAIRIDRVEDTLKKFDNIDKDKE